MSFRLEAQRVMYNTDISRDNKHYAKHHSCKRIAHLISNAHLPSESLTTSHLRFDACVLWSEGTGEAPPLPRLRREAALQEAQGAAVSAARLHARYCHASRGRGLAMQPLGCVVKTQLRSRFLLTDIASDLRTLDLPCARSSPEHHSTLRREERRAAKREARARRKRRRSAD
eukprot:2645644-Pleurochrysis_carterae.AAC.1